MPPEIHPRLFDIPADWEEHWIDMPEFVQEDAEAADSIRVHFRTDEDRRVFLRTHGYDPMRRRSIWWPHRPQLKMSTGSPQRVAKGRFPIYVISKGRATIGSSSPIPVGERGTAGAKYYQTTRELDALGLSFFLVCEPHEREDYARALGRDENILTLPFMNLGQGSIPARNWVWDHAVESGSDRHWILDDNIAGFYRLNRNQKVKITDENPFIPAEVFVERYENVGLAGLQYESFAPRLAKMPPFRLNTRVYSCILINHKLPFRWRGRYNEDTDLSLRALKDGWVTVLFNAYLCNKVATLAQPGGNTDELYAGNGRLKMAESLQQQHPDVVTITEKWGRPQHYVDYSPFKGNKLVLKDDGS